MSTTKTRLVMTLASAGVPVDRVPDTVPVDPADVTYMGGATQAQRDQAAALIAAFDWSPEADAAWQRGRTTEAAKGIVLSADDAQTRATRASCYALMLSLRDSRSKVNELVAWANAQGAAIEPLVRDNGDEDAFAAILQLLDMGI